MYHIKKRQFKNAMDMLEKLGWEEEAGLRDYVIEELKDESLLSYLLLFLVVCWRRTEFVRHSRNLSNYPNLNSKSYWQDGGFTGAIPCFLYSGWIRIS